MLVFLSFGFKYVSKRINPLIESIKIKNIQFQYKRVKYDKGKVFIITVGGIQLKISPTFVDNISKAEESKFLKRLNKKIIEGIYKYNLKNELKKSTEAFNEKVNDKLNVPIIQIDSINNDVGQSSIVYPLKNDNLKLNLSIPTLNNNVKKMSSSTNNVRRSKRPYKSMDILNKNSKENKGISTSTLYLAKPVEKVGFFQNLFYMIDNKYIFEIIIPTILSKIAINLNDIKVEVGFPEGSKVVFKQDYISLSSSKKESGVENKNKYFDYILFKHYNPYIFKIRFLFSEFNLKFYEANHSYSLSSFFDKNSINDSKKEDEIADYKEFDLLKSDEKNSIILSSILNCAIVRSNLNFSIRDIRCDSDGWINLIRLYSILNSIYENYFDIKEKEEIKNANNKRKKSIKEENNIFKKYGNTLKNNKNVRYIKSKIKNSSLKKYYYNTLANEGTKLNKKFSSECGNRLVNSCSSLKSESSYNEFDNSNLNGFMNNEFVQIFFFHLKGARISYHFQILNLQITSASHFCSNKSNSDGSLSFIDKYQYNSYPQFLNVITIGEISFKGEAFKNKSKLYNVVTSLSLKNLYLDMIDYETKFILQFFNIKSIVVKLEAIFQFYKYKQHLSYIKNVNFDFMVSTINLTSNLDYAYGLYQHINYILNNVSNKYSFNNKDDPFYDINRLVSVSRLASLEDLSKNGDSNMNHRRSTINLTRNINKPKEKTSLKDTIQIISKSYNKFSKLKVNINFGIKNIMFNCIVLSEKIKDYYSVNNLNPSLPNECILLQFGIKNISM